MNTRPTHRTPWLPVGTLALAAALAAAPVQAQLGPATLAGHWLIEGTPEAGSGIPPFVNVATLTRDGQMVNVDPGVGTAVGGWRRLQGTSYAVSFTGFMPGMPGVRYVVSATLGFVGGGQLSGPFRTEVLDPAGQPLFGYEGMVQAWRQAVDPY